MHDFSHMPLGQGKSLSLRRNLPQSLRRRGIEHLYVSKGVAMEYQLVFARDLNITPADFVSAWNEEANTQEVAEAQLIPSATKSFNAPPLDVVLLVVNAVV